MSDRSLDVQLGMDTSAVLHGHAVHFYDDERSLEVLASEYLGQALRAGHATVAIATPAHRDAFSRLIASTGLDVDAAVGSGRLVLADADEMLASFLLDGTPDAVGFDAAVGSLVRGLVSGGRPVSAFGEMVALLWEAGNVDAALDLERLWNVLGAATPFSLFCAYPSCSMERSDLFESFTEVCLQHGKVLAGAPEPPGAEFTLRFPRGPHAPGRARRFVATVLGQWGLADLVDQASLVVTELATNSLMHAHSAFTVSLTRTATAVRITVGDADGDAPAPRLSGTSMTSGRGLALVATLAARWGYSTVPSGKFVWADLATQPGAMAHEGR